MEIELIFRWLMTAIIVGAGLTIGVACAIGANQIITSVVTLLMTPITKKYHIEQYEYGKTYNQYQTIKINRSKWEVVLSDSKMLILRQGNKGERRHIVINYYEQDDIDAPAVIAETEIDMQPAPIQVVHLK